MTPNSKASARLREIALGLLAQHGGERGTATLIELARGEKDAKLRQMAVFWLGQTGDERALAFFKEVLAK